MTPSQREWSRGRRAGEWKSGEWPWHMEIAIYGFSFHRGLFWIISPSFHPVLFFLFISTNPWQLGKGRHLHGGSGDGKGSSFSWASVASPIPHHAWSSEPTAVTSCLRLRLIIASVLSDFVWLSDCLTLKESSVSSWLSTSFWGQLLSLSGFPVWSPFLQSPHSAGTMLNPCFPEMLADFIALHKSHGFLGYPLTSLGVLLLILLPSKLGRYHLIFLLFQFPLLNHRHLSLPLPVCWRLPLGLRQSLLRLFLGILSVWVYHLRMSLKFREFFFFSWKVPSSRLVLL